MKKIKWKAALLKILGIILLGTSVLLAIVFLLSPLALNCPLIFNCINSFLESLKYPQYKEAFIGASGGMIGSFLAITGALWVERRLAKDNAEKETEKIALILYYDIEMFYKEVSCLALNITWILGTPDKNEQREKYIEYKNYTGIHVHSDWISLVASLKNIITNDQIHKIYTFYGQISKMKTLIEKDNLQVGNIGSVNDIINRVGIKAESRYMPNKEYSEILNHLKQIAKIESD